MPRLYREAPVNSIWEGSGNVMCLDVLRAIERTPGAAEVLAAELDIGDEPRVQPFLDRLSERLAAEDRHDEAQARALVRDLVLALQAALLVKHAPPEVADAFCASRARGGAAAPFSGPCRAASIRARSSSAPRRCRGFTPSENRQHQHHLRDETDREGERAHHRNADRVDDGVREPRPEIDGAGGHRRRRRVASRIEDQHQRREDDQILDCIGVREIQPLRPGRLRLVVARRIGHRAHQPAHHDAIEDVGTHNTR